MQQFNEEQDDLIDGGDTMALIGLSNDELINPTDYNKVKEVIDFFKGAPDKAYIIRKIMKPGVDDKLNHVWQYVQIRKEHKEATVKIEEAKKIVNELSSKIRMRTEELRRYER
jgi:hypothetical protein